MHIIAIVVLVILLLFYAIMLFACVFGSDNTEVLVRDDLKSTVLVGALVVAGTAYLWFSSQFDYRTYCAAVVLAGVLADFVWTLHKMGMTYNSRTWRVITFTWLLAMAVVSGCMVFA